MSGRNKRAAVAFFAQLARDIRRREEEYEELISELEWRRSGPQGFADELARTLGVDVRVNDSFTVPYASLELLLDYRGNRTTVRVAAEEAMSCRRHAMKFCAEHGSELKLYPCTHSRRPIRKMADMPPIPADYKAWLLDLERPAVIAHTRLECQDCGATVG